MRVPPEQRPPCALDRAWTLKGNSFDRPHGLRVTKYTATYCFSIFCNFLANGPGLVHPFNKTMFAKNNRVESEHSSRAPFRARTAPASFYDVLNISRAADAKEIKEAFAKCRKAAQQEEKNEKIIEACQAYETLPAPQVL